MKVKIGSVEMLEADAPTVYDELQERSITPTTFESREYVASTDDSVFVEKYSNQGNSVLRFGINPKSILPEVGVLESNATAKATSGASSIRSSSTKYSTKEVEQVKHHSVEIDALQQAVSHLLNTGSKTVVVDILVRNKGVIEQPIDVHSVVLFKNPVTADGKDEVVVIDPSNFTFSSHLSNPDVLSRLMHTNLLISSIHKSTQIYHPEGKCGSQPDQYRDCIDLAVKIALKSRNEISIDIVNIEKYEFIKAISNTYVDNIFKEYDPGVAFRLKQSSNNLVVDAFRSIEASVHMNFKCLKEVVPPIQLNQEKDRYTEILTQAQEYNCLYNLIDYNDRLRSEIEMQLNANSVKLAGVKEDLHDGGIL